MNIFQNNEDYQNTEEYKENILSLEKLEYEIFGQHEKSDDMSTHQADSTKKDKPSDVSQKFLMDVEFLQWTQKVNLVFEKVEDDLKSKDDSEETNDEVLKNDFKNLRFQ